MNLELFPRNVEEYQPEPRSGQTVPLTCMIKDIHQEIRFERPISADRARVMARVPEKAKPDGCALSRTPCADILPRSRLELETPGKLDVSRSVDRACWDPVEAVVWVCAWSREDVPVKGIQQFHLEGK